MPAQAVVAQNLVLKILSKETQNTANKNPFDDIELVHVVRPRIDFDPKKKDKKNMPFQSIYFENGTGHIISTGGFLEHPYVIPRYLKASTEQYGRSPGMNALTRCKSFK